MMIRRNDPGALARRLLAGAYLMVLAPRGEPFAQSPAPDAAAAGEGGGVTRTRIITNTTSPTPLTVVSTEQLQRTTPSNIPDALNKLPVFQGSQQPRIPGAGGSLSAQNVLSLRGFGSQRTLVLLDGHRLAPSNS